MVRRTVRWVNAELRQEMSSDRCPGPGWVEEGALACVSGKAASGSPQPEEQLKNALEDLEIVRKWHNDLVSAVLMAFGDVIPLDEYESIHWNNAEALLKAARQTLDARASQPGASLYQEMLAALKMFAADGVFEDFPEDTQKQVRTIIAKAEGVKIES